MSDDPIPYTEVTEPSYGEIAAGTFSVVEVSADIMLLRGACPRCAAALEIPLVSSVFHGMRTIQETQPEQATVEGIKDARWVEPMVCTCEHSHPNRPEGSVGCGAFWNLMLTMDPA